MTQLLALIITLGAPSVDVPKATQIEASGDWLCARTAGAIQCRTPLANRTATLPGDYVDLSVGLGVCGLTKGGTIRCAALPRAPDKTAHPAPVAPKGRFTALFSHDRYACALDEGGHPHCFGEVMHGMVPAAERGTPQTMAGSASSGCVRDGDRWTCWPHPLPQPVVDWTALAIGGYEVCGLTAKGTVTCQQTAWAHASVARKGSLPTGSFARLLGDPGALACALDAQGFAQCFGKSAEYAGFVPAPKVAFAQVAIDQAQACGIDTTGHLHCWGGIVSYDGKAPLKGVPSGPFERIAIAADTQACAVNAAGAVACWGSAADPSIGEQLGLGPITALAISTSTVCVLRDGRVRCGGKHIEAPPPAGDDFIALDSTPSVFCAVRRSGAVACWGSAYVLENERYTPAPTDAVDLRIDNGAGMVFTRDGRINVWAGAARVAAPDDAFTALAPGMAAICGRTRAGSVTCWGGRRGRSAQTGATALTDHCAAFADGVRCWRDDVDRSKPVAHVKGTVKAMLPDQTGVVLHMADGTIQHTETRAHVPDATFKTVVGSARVRGAFCGLLADDTARCWSSLHGPITVALDGQLSALALSRGFLCGLSKGDGRVRCAGKPGE